MRYQVLTLFPELFDPFFKVGLVGRSVESQALLAEAVHLRDYAINRHGQVDDSPYGGGSGMVLRTETAAAAIRAAKERDPQALVVSFTPRGRPLTQELAKELCRRSIGGGGLILLCSRYEGIDERINERLVDLEISLGDFIMMGGEVAAMALIEATARLLPGILGNADSIAEESFEGGLLEYPQYTKPAEFEGAPVPEVLLSGNHRSINEWRKARRIEDTIDRRPDLIRKHMAPTAELSIALIHYPVLDKQGDVITSSITNIDIHDLARSAKTYGLAKCYIAHPVKALRRLALKICEHWETGYGFTYNPNRSDALSIISIVPELDDVLMDIEDRTGKLPKIVTTSARKTPNSTTFEKFAAILRTSDWPHLLLLGTGWGLTNEIIERADYHLEPIYGPTDYNHLSVRSAAAIMCDKLLGADAADKGSL